MTVTRFDVGMGLFIVFLYGSIFGSIYSCEHHLEVECAGRACPVDMTPHLGKDGCMCVVFPK